MTEEVLTMSICNTEGFQDDVALHRMFSFYLKRECVIS